MGSVPRNLTFLILADSQAVNGAVSGSTPKVAYRHADSGSGDGAGLMLANPFLAND